MTWQLAVEGLGVIAVTGLATVRQVALLLESGPAAVPQHDIWSILDRYGLPMLCLAGGAWFVLKILWPHSVEMEKANRETWKAQLEQAHAERKAEMAALMAQMEKRDEMTRLGFEKIADRLDRK